VQDELRLASDDDVDVVEAALGLQLPAGYRELVTTLGAGVIGGILRVFRPDDLEGRQQLYREVTEDAWFFEEPDETLTLEAALESIAIADSLDGDWAIFHPGTGRLHVLPRHDERTYSVGTDLWDVVAWFQDSGVLTYPHPFRYFESFAGPVEAVNGSGPDGNFREMTEAIKALGLHDFMETTRDHYSFFVRAIGGYVSFQPTGDMDVNVHFRYRADRAPDVRARIREAAIAAGVSFGHPWSMSTDPSA
jgi:hypothetical protein